MKRAAAGKPILEVGRLDEVKAALGDMKFTENDTFQSKVVLPLTRHSRQIKKSQIKLDAEAGRSQNTP